MLGVQFNDADFTSMEAVQERLEGALEQAERSTPPRSPKKNRSLSDGGTPILSPSPNIKEAAKRMTKDDSSIGSPTTPRRPAIALRGLSLQMPNREIPSPTPAQSNRVPPSPKLDPSDPYGSPSSVLPRRSRGLDFSRAATNLHHSTLAESSPDASPTITNRAMTIPNRRSGIFCHTSDAINHSSVWPSAPITERLNTTNSMGNIHMGSDRSDSSSDGDLINADDIDDSILSTPHALSMQYSQPSPSGWVGPSPAVSGFMNFQRARLRNGGGRHSSSSGSGISPSSRSPPTRQSGEGGNTRQPSQEKMAVRRESISWAANQLHISGTESEDGTLKSTLENMDSSPITPSRDGQRGVIRRVVTRRANMLPKTKGFARIRAALAEEGAPIETEARREAEVVRQTRESDMDLETRPGSYIQSSPVFGPMLPDAMEDDDIMTDSGGSSSFQQQAMRNSKGAGFWETFIDEKNRTTPPQRPLARASSTAMSEDISLDPPTISSSTLLPLNTTLSSTSETQTSSTSRSSTPQQSTGPTAAEITQKINKKRRREDDFDSTSIKRRAVSPGMSVHNSPVIQSPMQRDAAPWGSRPPSNGESKNGAGTKRVGFQGMVDTNDGLMKMSIE